MPIDIAGLRRARQQKVQGLPTDTQGDSGDNSSLAPQTPSVDIGGLRQARQQKTQADYGQLTDLAAGYSGISPREQQPVLREAIPAPRGPQPVADPVDASPSRTLADAIASTPSNVQQIAPAGRVGVLDRAKQAIREKTGYFEPPIYGQPPQRAEQPLKTIGQAGAYYTAKVLSGLGLNIPDIIASKTKGDESLADSVNRITGFTPKTSELEAGEVLDFMASLKTAGGISRNLINRIAARQALKTILNSGVTFAGRRAAEEVADKIVSNDPIDIEGIHFEGGVGVLFGAGEEGVRQFAQFVKGLRAGTAIEPAGTTVGGGQADSRAAARKEIQDALNNYKQTGDRTQWDRVRAKYTGAPAPSAPTPATQKVAEPSPQQPPTTPSPARQGVIAPRASVEVKPTTPLSTPAQRPGVAVAPSPQFASIKTSIGTIVVPKSELTGDVQDDLERIFEYGNIGAEIGVPQPELSRSLSVNDTVEYGGKTYRVQQQGFTLAEQPQYTSQSKPPELADAAKNRRRNLIQNEIAQGGKVGPNLLQEFKGEPWADEALAKIQPPADDKSGFKAAFATAKDAGAISFARDAFARLSSGKPLLYPEQPMEKAITEAWGRGEIKSQDDIVSVIQRVRSQQPTQPSSSVQPGEAAGGAQQIQHFTYAENIPAILKEGFDTSKPPIHGTGGLGGGPKTGKAGKDVLYFTTDQERWGVAEVYVGEGKGDITRTVYDYDNQRWVEEKNAYKRVPLEAVNASIKDDAKVLVIDSLAKAQGISTDRLGMIDDLVEYARKNGYDILNIKDPGGQAWADATPNKYGELNRYEELTGHSGKDDYFVINRNAIALEAPAAKVEVPQTATTTDRLTGPELLAAQKKLNVAFSEINRMDPAEVRKAIAGEALPSPPQRAKPGRELEYHAEQFSKGLEAGSVFEGGEVEPSDWAWRSMGPVEAGKLLSGTPFGGGEAKRGNWWSWFPSRAAAEQGKPGKPKYLFEVVGAQVKGEALANKRSIRNVTGIWKSEGKGWEKITFEQAVAELAGQPRAVANRVSVPYAMRRNFEHFWGSEKDLEGLPPLVQQFGQRVLKSVGSEPIKSTGRGFTTTLTPEMHQALKEWAQAELDEAGGAGIANSATHRAKAILRWLDETTPGLKQTSGSRIQPPVTQVGNQGGTTVAPTTAPAPSLPSRLTDAGKSLMFPGTSPEVPYIRASIKIVPGYEGTGSFTPEIQYGTESRMGGSIAQGHFHATLEQAQGELRDMLDNRGLPHIEAGKVGPTLVYSGSWQPGALEKQPGYSAERHAEHRAFVEDVQGTAQEVADRFAKEALEMLAFGDGPPQFGQWITPETVGKLPGIIENYGDFWLVLKWSQREPQLIRASDFAKHHEAIIADAEAKTGDDLREVFVRENPFDGLEPKAEAEPTSADPKAITEARKTPGITDKDVAELVAILNGGEPESIAQTMARLEGVSGARPSVKPVDAADLNKPTNLVSLPTKDIQADPGRFQYKLEATGPGGVTEKLQSVEKWNPKAAGTILVWKDNAGNLFVVDGHHRLALAKRLGVGEINAYLVREADGISPQAARVLGAMSNLADEKGTAIDAAKLFRDSNISLEDLRKEGVDIKSEIIRQGINMKALSDEVFRMVIDGKIPANMAAKIGEHVQSPTQQKQVADLIATGGITTVREAELLALTIDSSPVLSSTTPTLFGAETTEKSLYAERAKVLANVEKTLREDQKVFGTLSRKAGMIESKGNVLAKEANLATKQRADEILYLLDKLAHAKGPVSEALNHATVEYAKQPTKAKLGEVTKELIQKWQGELTFESLGEIRAGVPQSGSPKVGEQLDIEGLRKLREQRRRMGGFTPLPVDAAREIISVVRGVKDDSSQLLKAAWTFIRRNLRFGTNYMRTLGGSGRLIANDIEDITFAMVKKGARDLGDIAHVLRKLPKKQRELLAKIMNEREPKDGKSKDLLNRVVELRKILDRAMHEGAALGMTRGERPLFGIGHAFPQVPNAKGIEFLKEAKAEGKGSARVFAWAQEQVKEGRFRNVDQAVSALQDYRDNQLRGLNPYLERTRIELPTDMIEWDPAKVLPNLIERNWLTVEGVRKWGIDKEGQSFPRIRSRIERIRANFGQTAADRVESFIQTSFGLKSPASEQAQLWSNRLRGYQFITKIALSPVTIVRNMTDRLAKGMMNSMVGTVEALIKYPPFINTFIAKSQKLEDEMIRRGAIFGHTALSEGYETGSVVSQILRSPFMESERGNQVYEALVAEHALMRDLAILEKQRPGTLGRIVDRVSYVFGRGKAQAAYRVGPRLMKKLQEGEALTQDDIDRFLHEAVSKQAFPMILSSKPIWWDAHPMMKVLAQFRTWPLRQTKMIWDDVVKYTIKTKDPTRLIGFLTGLLIAGEIYNICRDILFDKDESISAQFWKPPENRKIARAILNDLVDGGVVGVVADLAYGVRDWAGGVVYGTSKNLFELFGNIKKTPGLAPAAIEKFMRKEVAPYRQVVAGFNKLDQIVNDDNISAAYLRWRAAAFEWQRTNAKPGIIGAVENYTDDMLFGRPEFPPSKNTLPLEMAARQVVVGDIKDAGKYIRYILRNAESGIDARQSLKQSMDAQSPLGPIPEEDRRRFLASLPEISRKRLLETDAAFRSNYHKAVTYALRGPRSEVDIEGLRQAMQKRRTRQ